MKSHNATPPLMEYSYGQQEPMENEAMVRTLESQARAIWPQEREILARLVNHGDGEVLDVGCGTGEIASRIAREFSPRRVVGVDIAGGHIRLAQHRFADLTHLAFQQGDATALPFADDAFDLALCRHMLQAISDPMSVIHEMIRVVRTGGWLYTLAEDYGMLFFHPTRHDLDEFFAEYGGRAAMKTGSDLRQGRKMPSILASLGCSEVQVRYLCVDTLRVDRNLLADIFLHWRDGFEEWISTHSGRPLSDVRARFDDMIACAKDPEGYAVWLIPCINARVTVEAKRRASLVSKK